MTHGHWSVAPSSTGSPPSRSRPALLLTGLLTCFPVLASSDALIAADPATPVVPMAPLVWPSQPVNAGPSPSVDRSEALSAWQRANARVADFPRGHADLLKWEAQQQPTAPSPDARQGSSLSLSEALQRSVILRPDLVAGPNALPAAQIEIRSAWSDHTRQVQGAWLAAVAAKERLAIASEVLDNARVGAELGRRMVEAGNWSQVRHLREQLVETRARQAWMSAALAVRIQTEQLARWLGAWDNAQAQQLVDRLPDRLPAVPPQVPQHADAQAKALAGWPGLESQRQRLRTALPLPGLDEWDSAVSSAAPHIDAGNPSATTTNPALQDWRLFNNHRIQDMAKERAEVLSEATWRRSQVREAEAAMQANHALARLAQEELLAQQRTSEQETLLRYNGMLMSTWDLLAAARERLSALDHTITARLNYWQAEADWRSLMAGGRYAGAQGAPGDGASGKTETAAGGH